MAKHWSLKPWMKNLKMAVGLFTIGATVDGELVAEAKGYNKKDASQIAAQLAVDKLGL